LDGISDGCSGGCRARVGTKRALADAESAEPIVSSAVSDNSPTASAPPDPLTQPGPWNDVAAGYNEAFFQRLPEVLDRAIALLEPAPVDTVLDLATGPGTFAVRIAPLVARVVAIDFAAKMIDELCANLTRLGLDNVEARVMDGHALGFEDGAFDVVASMFGWFMFADRARALAEIHRVLRPGGRLLVSSWMPPDRNMLLGAALSALRVALPDLPRPAGPLPTQIPEVVAGELRAAGFREVATEIVAAAAPMSSVEEFWHMFERAGAPLVLLRKKMGDEAWRPVADRCLDHLRAQFGSGSFVVPGQAIVATARR
jgi:ubiquinone/menaquinone biosynthesis C-methylase UbiE